jgi:phosphate transport system permease protein
MRTTTPDDFLNMGGAAHAIVGSLLMVLIATVITLPLGILSGVYVTEVRGRFSGLVRFVIQSMSGVPSIVAGLFVYTTFNVAATDLQCIGWIICIRNSDASNSGTYL